MNNDNPQNDQNEVSRRWFLEAAGFSVSLAAVAGCGRAAPQTALPFAVAPAEMIPGRMRSYASTCSGCPAGCGLLVGVRDGRPLKMEGMPEHPVSSGGLCAIGQSLTLGLYDNYRFKKPSLKGKKDPTWSDIDQHVIKQLGAVGDKASYLVTPTVTSPTLKAVIEKFTAKFGVQHVTLDAISSSAILEAHNKTHKQRVLPHYKFEQAKVIVSLGADFLGTWISPVEFTAGWSSQRVPTEEHPEMSYHAQLEGRLSLTGCNADRRFQVAPDEYGIVLSHLYQTLKGEHPKNDEKAISNPDLTALAKRLSDAHKGETLVVSDSQDVDVQVLVNAINDLLGNYGKTLDVTNASNQRQGNDADVAKLVEDLTAKNVGALLVAGTDLTHNLPAVKDSISEDILAVSFATLPDEFTELANVGCPDHHALESWADAEPITGQYSLSQPTLAPLNDTRSTLESLARWTGDQRSVYDILQTHWEDSILPEVKSGLSWKQAIQKGIAEDTNKKSGVGTYSLETEPKLFDKQPSEKDVVLTLYSKVGMFDSTHAQNPWLQELPDPVTKVTWDNYVSMSKTRAKLAGVDKDGDVVTVKTDSGEVQLPALIQRGQHDRVISIALGYGAVGSKRFHKIGPQWIEGQPTVAKGGTVGENAAALTEMVGEAGSEQLRYSRNGLTITAKPGIRRPLARTQEYHSLEMPDYAPPGAEKRDTVQKTTLVDYKANPHHGAAHVHPAAEEQLWAEDHDKERSWGMSIDLNACSGCSACLIACQSENNVPVVGKDEVFRQREMHWLRIDRYFMGKDDDLQVLHQPMMCQHCDNAPCETVCPALATVHSEEGLNEQVYNRCVGTRYCANNCPYKVRRFNWFGYGPEPDNELATLAHNPDVTVRGRGVMEKCSMCVQRIEDKKIAARQRGTPLEDGELQTACQQSCPAKAIEFGDMISKKSKVHAARQDPRSFRVLEEFNFRPAINYLRVVRNSDEAHGADDHAAGGTHG